MFSCAPILIFGDPYQFTFIPTLTLLLSTIPLLFLRESVYRLWRRFALVAFPLAILLITLAPLHDRSVYGVDREYVTFLTSALFLLASYALITYKTLRTRQ